MLQNYGAFIEKDGAGIRGTIKITGFENGHIDLSKSLWTYQVCIYVIMDLRVLYVFLFLCVFAYVCVCIVCVFYNADLRFWFSNALTFINDIVWW